MNATEIENKLDKLKAFDIDKLKSDDTVARLREAIVVLHSGLLASLEKIKELENRTTFS